MGGRTDAAHGRRHMRGLSHGTRIHGPRAVGTLRGRTSCTLKRATAVRGSREGRRVVCVCCACAWCVTLPLCVNCVSWNCGISDEADERTPARNDVDGRDRFIPCPSIQRCRRPMRPLAPCHSLVRRPRRPTARPRPHRKRKPKTQRRLRREAPLRPSSRLAAKRLRQRRQRHPRRRAQRRRRRPHLPAIRPSPSGIQSRRPLLHRRPVASR